MPERVVTNAELSQNLGEDVDKFVPTFIGIRERRIAAENKNAADLATAAASAASAEHRHQPPPIFSDLIVLATDTPEYLSPGHSVVVQHRLGAKNAGTFDLNMRLRWLCDRARHCVQIHNRRCGIQELLVIGCYAMSNLVDWTEKKTATIFADGAGASSCSPKKSERVFSRRSSSPMAIITIIWASSRAARGADDGGSAAENITTVSLREKISARN